MSEIDPRLDDWVGRLREYPESDAARARLLARVRAPIADRPSLAVHPLALAAAAVMLVLVTSAAWLVVLRGAPASAPAVANGALPVQFVYHAEDARSVYLVGDFNDWRADATPLAHSGDGVWSVVLPMRPGMVTYSFLVDGHEWRADPAATPAANSFGRPTSLTFIRAQEGET